MVDDGGVSYEDDDDEAVHQELNAASEEVNATQTLLLLIVLLYLLHLSDYCSYRILSVNQNNHYYCNIYIYIHECHNEDKNQHNPAKKRIVIVILTQCDTRKPPEVY